MFKLNNIIRSEFDLFIDVIDKYANTSPYSIIYIIGKTLLATSLLVTLLFNDMHSLFVEHMFNKGENDFFHHINLFTHFSYNDLWIPKLISIFILLFTISGYLPQLSGLLHWWVCCSFFTSAVLVDGGDQINTNVTLLLIPLTLLDNRLNSWSACKKGKPARNLIAWMFFFFIEVQGAFLYLQASIEKPYKLEEWRNGTAVYYWFNNNIYGATNFFLAIINPILTNPYLAFIVSWGAILLELSLFGAFFMLPKRRVRLFILAITFHFLILLFQGLNSFFFSISGLLFIYLLNRHYAFKLNQTTGELR